MSTERMDDELAEIERLVDEVVGTARAHARVEGYESPSTKELLRDAQDAYAALMAAIRARLRATGDAP